MRTERVPGTSAEVGKVVGCDTKVKYWIHTPLFLLVDSFSPSAFGLSRLQSPRPRRPHLHATASLPYIPCHATALACSSVVSCRVVRCV